MPESHPLYRPQNRRRLRLLGIGLVLIVFAAEPLVHLHTYFDFAGIFGFHGVSALIATVAFIVVALLLAVVLRRPEDYYHDAG